MRSSLPDRHEGAARWGLEGSPQTSLRPGRSGPGDPRPATSVRFAGGVHAIAGRPRTPSSLLLKSSTSRAIRARVERSSGSSAPVASTVDSCTVTASPTARNRPRSFRVFWKGSVALRPDVDPPIRRGCGAPPAWRTRGPQPPSRHHDPHSCAGCAPPFGHHSWRGPRPLRCAPRGWRLLPSVSVGGSSSERAKGLRRGLPNREARMVRRFLDGSECIRAVRLPSPRTMRAYTSMSSVSRRRESSDSRARRANAPAAC